MRRKARSQPRTRTKKVVAARTTRAARQAVLARQRAVKTRAVVPIAAAGSDSSSLLLPLTLGAALGLSLLVVILALTPPWALSTRTQALVYGRRESLVFGGFAIALSIGLGIAIAAL